MRSNTATPLEQSEDQEDELLSIVSIKGYGRWLAPVRVASSRSCYNVVSLNSGSKHVVGTQLGVVTVWDRTKGWSDSIDRIMGSVPVIMLTMACASIDLRPTSVASHPQSVETLVALTPDVIATGSEDGIIRVMQIQPNKLRMSS